MIGTQEQIQAQLQQCNQLLVAGRAGEALSVLDGIAAVHGELAPVEFLKAQAYQLLGDKDNVILALQRVIAIQSSHHGAWCNLARIYLSLNRTVDALDACEHALSLCPDDPIMLTHYGRALTINGRFDEALAILQRSLVINNDMPATHTALGIASQQSGNTEAAMQAFNCALQLDPDDLNAHLGMALLLLDRVAIMEAEKHYRRVIEINPSASQGYRGMAEVELFRGNYDNALEYLDRADQLGTTNDPAIAASRAICYEHRGDNEKACVILQQLDADGTLSYTALIAYARVCHHLDACDRVIKLIDTMLETGQPGEMERQSLLYSCGALLDQQGRYDAAFTRFSQANRINRSTLNLNYRKMYDVVIDHLHPCHVNSLPHADTRSDRPIFIVGMPRSGTTLIESILTAHPDVYAGGELGDMGRIAHELSTDHDYPQTGYAEILGNLSNVKLTLLANGYLEMLETLNSKSRYITDKMPHNFQYVGLIAALFPDARIIHCRRNPLDTCLSIYTKNFHRVHTYATDLAELGKAYTEYHRLMQHWEQFTGLRMISVQYEDLLADQEAVSRTLLEFCGLEWDDAVMAFHQKVRFVATASYDQVRKPVYTTSVGRWRNYAAFLSPLAANLPSELLTGIDGLETIPGISNLP